MSFSRVFKVFRVERVYDHDSRRSRSRMRTIFFSIRHPEKSVEPYQSFIMGTPDMVQILKNLQLSTNNNKKNQYIPRPFQAL